MRPATIGFELINRGRARLLAATLLLVALSACGGSPSGSSGGSGLGGSSGDATTSRSTPAGARPATADEVAALIAEAATITRLPADLTPALPDAPNDLAVTAVGQAGCNTSQPTEKPKDCIYGDAASQRVVVLFGDSHAGMWLPAFDLAGQRASWKVVLLFQPGCPPPEVDIWDTVNQRPNTECTAWRAWAIQHINDLKPNLIVITSEYYYSWDFNKKVITDDVWSRGLTAVIGKLRPVGAPITVLGDIPYLAQGAPDCLAAHADNVQSCSTARSEAVVKGHNQREKETAISEGAQYVDVVPWLCGPASCFAVIGNMVVYRDRAHVSATYARWLSGVIWDAVKLN